MFCMFLWTSRSSHVKQKAPLSPSMVIHALRPSSSLHSSHIESRFEMKTFMSLPFFNIHILYRPSNANFQSLPVFPYHIIHPEPGFRVD